MKLVIEIADGEGDAIGNMMDTHEAHVTYCALAMDRPVEAIRDYSHRTHHVAETARDYTLKLEMLLVPK